MGEYSLDINSPTPPDMLNNIVNWGLAAKSDAENNIVNQTHHASYVMYAAIPGKAFNFHALCPISQKLPKLHPYCEEVH